MRALPAIDVGLLLRDDPLMSSTSSPVKFAEYLVSGVPVVLSPWAGDFSALAERENLGIALDPHSPDCAERVTAFLQEVCANRQDYAQRCSSYARARLSWESYRSTLAAILAGRPADTPLGDKDCVEESHAA
jgi:glycosyltransferase involved in cell wall biosynthesis